MKKKRRNPHTSRETYKGWTIYYDERYTGDSTWEGRNSKTHRVASADTKEALKRLIDRDTKNNPSILKPKLGKWIPVHAVKFLKGGITQLMK
jgi:hypothetical protein